MVVAETEGPYPHPQRMRLLYINLKMDTDRREHLHGGPLETRGGIFRCPQQSGLVLEG